MRIWKVNHSYNVEHYLPSTKTYPAGSNVPLPSEMYYFDVNDLTGYHLQVTGTEIIRTEDYLKQHGASFKDLQEISQKPDVDYYKYGLVYLVHADFTNDKWKEKSDSAVRLDDFLLTGSDYCVSPATDTLTKLPDVNPELKGSSSFAIRHNRTFHVDIPYLIDTSTATHMTEKYLTQHRPKLLIAVYPEEIYLELK
ncbi:MAG: DUF5028 domain-containing protein [Lachnospiraceae bacterium]|nr:DUF5028 domain-containing protein [Lachnospiraceae bacterium]